MKHLIAILFAGAAMFYCGTRYGEGKVAVAMAKAVLEKEIEEKKKESSENE